MKESDILYSKNGYWLVLEARKSPGLALEYKTYAIYKDGVTHATLLSNIGYSLGLQYAKDRLDVLAAGK